MKNTENFKTAWWGILVVVIGFYLFERFDQLVAGKPSYLDALVFLVWVGVCLAPIFQEMDIFGLKLKQQVEDLKKEMNYQLSILKTEIKSSIDISSANQNHISVNAAAEPAKDSDIPHIQQEVNRILKQKGIIEASPSELPSVNEVSVELFKVRLAFEKLVAEYTQNNKPVLSSNGRRQVFALGRVLNELRRISPISPDVLGGVSEIISICNYGIHGEIPSENQLNFVRESSGKLYKALDSEFREHYL
jgi:hypothetical protein